MEDWRKKAGETKGFYIMIIISHLPLYMSVQTG
jgi:hypothetical protein